MKKLNLTLVIIIIGYFSVFAQTSSCTFVVDCKRGVMTPVDCKFEISGGARPIDIFNIRCTQNCAAYDYDRNYGTLGRAFLHTPYTNNGGRTWIHEVRYMVKKCYDGDNQPSSVVEVYY